MKSIVLILNCLMLVIALVAVLVALAFAPVVQTWIAQALFARQSAVQGSVEAVSAHFGKVEIGGLTLKSDGAGLTVPTLRAELPLMTALLDRRFVVRRLVAKGWTLDLRQAPVVKEAAEKAGSGPEVEGVSEAPVKTEPVSAQDIVRIFRGTLSRWALPCDVSLDGADLEGDVVLPLQTGSAPTRMHVIIKGGGMAAGREGAFTFDAACDFMDPAFSEIALTGRGGLAIAMKSPRTFSRVEVKGDFSAGGGPFPNGLTFSADATDALGADGETFSVDLSREGQHLATILARLPGGADQFSGTWKFDLQDSDVALFTLGRPLPHFTATGEGRFDSDIALTRVHALGRLSASISNPGALGAGMSNLGVLGPWIERLGAVAVTAGFDEGYRSGQSIRVEHRMRPWPEPDRLLQSLQPFEVDEHTGELKPANPADAWMQVSIRGFPLEWLSGLTGGFALSGGDAAGEFIVRTDKGGFDVRSKTPVTAAGVSLQRASKTFGRKLDVSLSLIADYNSQEWHFQAAPLTVASEGSRLATVVARASRPAGSDEPVVVSGTWNVDLQILAAKAVVPDLGWISGRSASGDFSAKVGTSIVLDGKLIVLGYDERHSVSAGVHVEADADGRILFLGPVKVASGPGESDLSTEGTWIPGGAENRFYLKLSGKDVFIEHLRLIADSLAAAGGVPKTASAGAKSPAGIRDRVPFWGDWAGRVLVAFDRVKAGEYVFKEVGGALEVAHGSVHLEGGGGALADQRFTNVEGLFCSMPPLNCPTISRRRPPSIESTWSLSFPAADYRGNPPVEGSFSMAATLIGNGIKSGGSFRPYEGRVPADQHGRDCAVPKDRRG